jgi:hypothetical protein
MVWKAVPANGASIPLGQGASISANLNSGTYTIIFQVTDPTSGQVSSPSVSITVQLIQ